MENEWNKRSRFWYILTNIETGEGERVLKH